MASSYRLKLLSVCTMLRGDGGIGDIRLIIVMIFTRFYRFIDFKGDLRLIVTKFSDHILKTHMLLRKCLDGDR